MKNKIQTIYVKLLDEDIEVFVPTQAIQISDKVFEIVSYDEDLELENLEFKIRDKVVIGYKKIGEREEKKDEMVALYRYEI